MQATDSNAAEFTGWASIKPGRTKYHYYTAGKSLCSYQRQPGQLHPYPFTQFGRKTPEDACSSCELAFSRLHKAKPAK